MALIKKAIKGRSADSAIIRVIGRDGHLEFTLNDKVPLPVVEKELRGYLARVEGRFEGGRVSLILGNRMMNVDQITRFRHILEDQHELILAGLSFGADALQHLLSAKTLPHIETPVPEKAKVEDVEVPTEVRITPPLKEPRDGDKPVAIEGQETILVKGTCRSGTTILNTGNVVVAGDVNPGAEITATKDIIIFGRLAGLAHAGASGAEDAVIIALQIEAPQLRIGPHIKMEDSVRNGKRSTKTPKMALVKGDTIVVKPFITRSVWKQEE